jgi:cytidylate kinase
MGFCKDNFKMNHSKNVNDFWKLHKMKEKRWVAKENETEAKIFCALFEINEKLEHPATNTINSEFSAHAAIRNILTFRVTKPNIFHFP